MRVRDNDRPSENFNGISFDTEREREKKTREGEKHTKYKRKIIK